MTPPREQSSESGPRPRLGTKPLLVIFGLLAITVAAMALLGGTSQTGDGATTTTDPAGTTDSTASAGPTSVTLDVPADGTRVRRSGVVVLGATVRSGRPSLVEFLVDGEVVGERTRTPLVVAWQPADEGIHEVAIRTTAPDGAVTTSRPIDVVVGDDHECEGADVAPGENVQAVIDAEGTDATICFLEGRYELMAPLVPRNGQTLAAMGEVIVTGARPLPEWRPLGDGRWEATGVEYSSPPAEGEGCEDTDPRCGYNEDVYLDGVRLHHVADVDSVVPGTFSFDRAGGRIVIADDPTGRSLEVAVTPAAFESKARNVSIVGFVVEKFATPHQRGAIDGGNGWRIEANEVRDNHAVGIRTAPGSVLVGNHVHGNGQFGLAGNGTASVVASNTLESNGDILWCCGRVGGSKWVLASGLQVRGNLARDHLRNGLWTDINNVDVVYEYNIVTGNGLIGIHHEISYAAVIRHNLLEGNGSAASLIPGAEGDRGGDLVITASRDVEVHDNEFVGTGALLLVNQRNRLGDHPSDLGPHQTADIWVHDNVFVLGGGATIGSIIGGSSPIGREQLAAEVTFEANVYEVEDPAAALFTWGGVPLDWEGWRRAGNDGDGELHSRDSGDG